MSAELDAHIARAEATIADLEADLGAIAESTALVPDDEHDAEGSTVGYERARVGALLHLVRSRLAGLRAAAARERRGDEALCDQCGRPIPAERLAALPATHHCVSCAVAAAADH